MLNWLILILSLIGLLFLGVVFFGAPYLPTRKRDLSLIFKDLNLPAGSLVVDLGSGDGRVLAAAASLGYRAIGYELNPILVLFSRLSLKKFSNLARVELKNYWQVDLPPDTAAVFVFLAGPYMNKFQKYLKKHLARAQKPLFVISYGFELPNQKPLAQNGAVLIYKLIPLQP